MSALNAGSPLRRARSNTTTNKWGLLGHVARLCRGFAHIAAQTSSLSCPLTQRLECRPSAASAAGRLSPFGCRHLPNSPEHGGGGGGGEGVSSRPRTHSRAETSSRPAEIDASTVPSDVRTSAAASLSHRPSAAAGCPPHPMHHGRFVRSVSLIVREAQGTFCLVAPECLENLRIRPEGDSQKFFETTATLFCSSIQTSQSFTIFGSSSNHFHSIHFHVLQPLFTCCKTLFVEFINL